MFVDQINLNHIRIFECVYRTGSMTSAAHELNLTQSGVSQHIKSLEEVLGVKLFDRINQRLLPTQEANFLYEKSSKSLNELEMTLASIKGISHELTGTVSVGMPVEFGINVIIPLLCRFSKEHPLVKFQIRLDYASQMNDAILKGVVDFAFVDEFSMDKRISVEKVYDEILELCIHTSLLGNVPASKMNRAFFESLKYVEYQEGAPVLKMWFNHHLNAKHIDLDIAAMVMDVHGIAKLIQGKMGAGILPRHFLDKLQTEESELYIFKGCGKPLKNSISLAYLDQRSYSSAAKSVIESLKSWLKENEKTNSR